MSKKPPDDQALIEDLRKSLKRQYGVSAVSALGSADSRAEVRSGISSQSLCLDMAIGRPGFPAGRIIEISGLESVGKTLIGLHAVAETQRLGGIAMICDAEMGLDLAFVRKMGVIPGPSVLLLQAPSLEDAFTIIEQGIVAVRRKHRERPFLVLFDSIAGCLTKDELAGNYDDKVPARHARVLSPALRKLADLCARKQVALVLINQLRCLPVDTLVSVDGLLSSMEDVVPGSQIVRDAQRCARVAAVSKSGVVSGRRLSLRYRGCFSLSDQHVQPVVTASGLTEKMGADIASGDWLASPVLDGSHLSDDAPYFDLKTINAEIRRNACQSCKDVELPDALDEKTARFLGMYYADGCVVESGRTARISFTEIDLDRFRLLVEVSRGLFHDAVRVCEDSHMVTIDRRWVVEFVRALGLGDNRTEKKIPKAVIGSRKSVILEFIRGASFDSHGFGAYGFIFTAEGKAGQKEKFADLLYQFGIFADVRTPRYRLRKGQRSQDDHLYITGEDAVRFREVVGFLEPKKSGFARRFSFVDNARGKYDVVPNSLARTIFEEVKRVSQRATSLSCYGALKMCLWKELNAGRSKLLMFVKDGLGAVKCPGDARSLERWAAFLESHRFCEILSVSPTKFEAIDIEVEDGLFVASRFLTHNSSIGAYGGQPDSFGGKALRFHMSVRIRIKKTDVIRSKNKDIVGISVKAQVIKNKVAEPFRSATLNFHFQHGLDKAGDLWMAACKIGEVVKGEGGWYHVGEHKLRRKQWRKYLMEELGGWEKYREHLLEKAIEKGIVLDYS